MEVAVAPIYFTSPAGPQGREMRWCRNEPVPEPNAHVTQFILLADLRVYAMCLLDFSPKTRRSPMDLMKWRVKGGDMDHPRRGRKYGPHIVILNDQYGTRLCQA